jgi:uncharacterized protein (TIGR00299 family) protein
MRIAYFDTIAGVSGDMTLGAFVSAGVRLEDLQGMIPQLGLQGVEIQASHIIRNGITAVKIDVVITEQHEGHRHLRDIMSMIDESALNKKVKENAKIIFLEIGKAEAKVHNTKIEKIHFHEVGALDSIVDIVGAALCVDLLKIEKIYSSPVKLGSGGFIGTEHGNLPLPGPAAVEILKGYPTVLTAIPFELTTPTGAAIIKALSSGVITNEKIVIEETGYGAGTREIAEVPNLLRIMVGRMADSYEEDEVVNIETNIDDMNPEVYPFLLDQLFAQGAYDSYLVPVLMKKGRPGVLLSVLAHRAQLDMILGIIFSQTTTLGVRIQPVERKKLRREEREIQTRFGKVRVKVIHREGREQIVPEYEECKRLALGTGTPLIEIYSILERDFFEIEQKTGI